jgi:hypothetical protein
MDDWERTRIAKKGDGVPFTTIFPDFEEYFEQVRALAGEEGPGRRLPPFDAKWVQLFMEGHERRKKMWEKNNEKLSKTAQTARLERARL